MSSDSDSDFGDFDQGSVHTNSEDENPNSVSTLTELIERTLGKPKFPDTEREVTNIEQLLEEERPRVIYEQLVLLEPYLHPVKWETSNLRSLLLRTLNVEEAAPQAAERKILQDSLYLKLEENMTLSELGVKKLNSEVPHKEIPDLLAISDFSSMTEDKIKIVHDQLIDAIGHVLKDISDLNLEEKELLDDKSTFEQVVTNLVGHTQRLRREEIASYKKKNKIKVKRR